LFFDKKVLGQAEHNRKIIKIIAIAEIRQLVDHLGNIHVTIDEQGDVVTADNYYLFGLQMPGRSYNVAFSGNQYKYNSKELDDENGLDWYSYGARYYDPQVARWFVIDPLLDKYPGFSPYIYASNNPVIYIDPDGKDFFKSALYKKVEKAYNKFAKAAMK
jgi:RHS repeat-associated protein